MAEVLYYAIPAFVLLLVMEFLAYAGLYELTPLRMPADEWWTYALLFFADDFAYYWFHRIHHEVRVFWASHVVHHSSEHYNLSTALRHGVGSLSRFSKELYLGSRVRSASGHDCERREKRRFDPQESAWIRRIHPHAALGSHVPGARAGGRCRLA